MEKSSATGGSADKNAQPASFSMSMSKSLKARNKRKLGQDKESLVEQREGKLENEERDFITGFSEKTIESVKPKQEKVQLVIPLTKNPWAEKDSPSSSSSAPSKTVTQDSSTGGPEGSVSSQDVDKSRADVPNGVATEDAEAAAALLQDLEEESKDSASKSSTRVIPNVTNTPASQNKKNLPVLIANRVPGLEQIEDEAQKLKHDLSHRPDELDVNSVEYAAVPVTEFGEALLRGMGWKGREHEEDKTHVFEPRHHRLGLGATPRPPELESKKRRRKPGEKSREKEIEKQRKKYMEEVSRSRRNGKVYTGDKSSKAAVDFYVDDIVQVRRGELQGKRALVVKVEGVPGLDKVEVELERSARRLAVAKRDLVLVEETDLEEAPFSYGPSQKEKDTGKTNESAVGTTSTERESNGRSHAGLSTGNHKAASREQEHKRKRSSERDVSRDGGEKEKKKKHKKKSHRDDRSPKDAKNSRTSGSWLCPNIRVRVVSKKVGGERLYSKKGIVQDVMERGVGVIMMDGTNQIVDRVKERHLETVVPKVGGCVRVVLGQYRNETGEVLEKDTRREEVIVRLHGDMNVVKIGLDDVSEYLGAVHSY